MFYFLLVLLCPLDTQAVDVAITEDIDSVKVVHNGTNVTIMRNQNPDNIINPAYAKTSRKCPPFCIQPVTIAEGVETTEQLELLRKLKCDSIQGFLFSHPVSPEKIVALFEKGLPSQDR